MSLETEAGLEWYASSTVARQHSTIAVFFGATGL